MKPRCFTISIFITHFMCPFLYKHNSLFFASIWCLSSCMSRVCLDWPLTKLWFSSWSRLVSRSLLALRGQILSIFRCSHILCAPQRAQPVSLSSSDLESSQIGFTSQKAPRETFFKLLVWNQCPQKSHILPQFPLSVKDSNVLTLDLPSMSGFILHKFSESLSLLSHPVMVFTSVYGYWLQLKRKQCYFLTPHLCFVIFN